MEFFLVLMIKHFIVDLGAQQYLGPGNKQQWLGAGQTIIFNMVYQQRLLHYGLHLRLQ